MNESGMGPVVVGFDGSDHARAAVDWAAREAQLRGLPLALVTAFAPPVGGSSFGFGAYLSPAALDDVTRRVQEDLDKAADEIRRQFPGLEVEARVLLGSPASALVESSEGATLAVVGSRGLGGFRGLLLGSVGVQVATHSMCPAVVVRKAPPNDARTVVVGVDGSAVSMAAVEFAFDMASRHGWSVRAVHAWEVPSYDVLAAPNGAPPLSVDDLLEAEVRVPAEAVAGLRDRYPDVAVEEKVVKGASTRVLLDESKDAALIVVGSRGRGEFTGALLGSVGQGVLHRAEVPVAVVGDTS